MSDIKRVLFVCVENANRSQMAEAMRELGYDLSAHGSKSLDELPEVEFDFVATMGCGDACPMVRARQRADWSIPDPKHLPADEFRDVRDLIRDKIQATLDDLSVDT